MSKRNSMTEEQASVWAMIMFVIAIFTAFLLPSLLNIDSPAKWIIFLTVAPLGLTALCAIIKCRYEGWRLRDVVKEAIQRRGK